jgi:hypothetical protein
VRGAFFSFCLFSVAFPFSTKYESLLRTRRFRIAMRVKDFHNIIPTRLGRCKRRLHGQRLEITAIPCYERHPFVQRIVTTRTNRYHNCALWCARNCVPGTRFDAHGSRFFWVHIRTHSFTLEFSVSVVVSRCCRSHC